MARRKSKLFINNVDGFSTLPLDVLCEIFSSLLPRDLLHLARTNKALRSFVLNRSNSMIWKAAFANNALAKGPPRCPPYMSEPAWAHVAFDNFCEGCQENLRVDPNVDMVWWEFGGRYCSDCVPTLMTIVIPAKLKRLYPADTIPERVLPRIGRDAPGEFRWYNLVSDQTKLLQQLSATRSAARRREITLKRIQDTALIQQHSMRCRYWAASKIDDYQDDILRRKQAKANKDGDLLRAKAEQVAKRLRARGWGDEDWMVNGMLARHLQYYPDFENSKSLTARLSREFDDRLVARLTADRKKYLQQEGGSDNA
uniref:F-box domain-containing protein n=1 Tax=Mycena chlorophos TaxID=658473 RepID=A0ABQ0M8D5_MYCCL|nr:predicted protein [Mycena chlorophos]